ncbi:ribonuclease VapC [Sphaerisporangium rufum]|uniref:Ribonuclease VapC n=1 Tax=Sphaerisporangium rufum TaxID=1381558 RepID=A0A919V210_9ACTN|nr:type II toxin-antitoxin system VapC family toxin [Sphaerisporangium rufum]GII80279.1 ribonuclease VapC [Sphaerisporangium rufum]
MIVFDTNVISELMRSQPSAAVVDWVRSQPGRELYTTSVTLAEVTFGIERLPDGNRKQLLKTVADEVFATFEEQVLPFDAAAARPYAVVVTERERAGLPIDGFDAQIAAICRTHGAALATRNIKDFHGTGVEVIDPWHAD